MHVAKRDRYEAGGDSAAGHLNGSSICASRSRVAFELVGDVTFLGSLDQFIEYDGIDVWTASNDRSCSQFGFPELALVAIRMIRAVANIHGDCEIRIYTIARCSGTSDADFFLGGAHRYDFCF